MKPIKRGMTEAVTRDGRKVTQLTWFENVAKGAFCVSGVMDGFIETWNIDGIFDEDELPNSTHPCDIFAPVEYEWQWLIKNSDGTFDVSAFRSFGLNLAGESCINGNKGSAIWYSRIEESKREVKA